MIRFLAMLLKNVCVWVLGEGDSAAKRSERRNWKQICAFGWTNWAFWVFRFLNFRKIMEFWEVYTKCLQGFCSRSQKIFKIGQFAYICRQFSMIFCTAHHKCLSIFPLFVFLCLLLPVLQVDRIIRGTNYPGLSLSAGGEQSQRKSKWQLSVSLPSTVCGVRGYHGIAGIHIPDLKCVSVCLCVWH